MAESLKMNSDFDNYNKDINFENYQIDIDDLDNNLNEIENFINETNKNLKSIDIEEIYIDENIEKGIKNMNNNVILNKLKNILTQQSIVSDNDDEPKSRNNINTYDSLLQTKTVFKYNYSQRRETSKIINYLKKQKYLKLKNYRIKQMKLKIIGFKVITILGTKALKFYFSANATPWIFDLISNSSFLFNDYKVDGLIMLLESCDIFPKHLLTKFRNQIDEVKTEFLAFLQTKLDTLTLNERNSILEFIASKDHKLITSNSKLKNLWDDYIQIKVDTVSATDQEKHPQKSFNILEQAIKRYIPDEHFNNFNEGITKQVSSFIEKMKTTGRLAGNIEESLTQELFNYKLSDIFAEETVQNIRDFFKPLDIETPNDSSKQFTSFLNSPNIDDGEMRSKTSLKNLAISINNICSYNIGYTGILRTVYSTGEELANLTDDFMYLDDGKEPKNLSASIYFKKTIKNKVIKTMNSASFIKILDRLYKDNLFEFVWSGTPSDDPNERKFLGIISNDLVNFSGITFGLTSSGILATIVNSQFHIEEQDYNKEKKNKKKELFENRINRRIELYEKKLNKPEIDEIMDEEFNIYGHRYKSKTFKLISNAFKKNKMGQTITRFMGGIFGVCAASSFIQGITSMILNREQINLQGFYAFFLTFLTLIENNKEDVKELYNQLDLIFSFNNEQTISEKFFKMLNESTQKKEPDILGIKKRTILNFCMKIINYFQSELVLIVDDSILLVKKYFNENKNKNVILKSIVNNKITNIVLTCFSLSVDFFSKLFINSFFGKISYRTQKIIMENSFEKNIQQLSFSRFLDTIIWINTHSNFLATPITSFINRMMDNQQENIETDLNIPRVFSSIFVLANNQMDINNNLENNMIGANINVKNEDTENIPKQADEDLRPIDITLPYWLGSSNIYISMEMIYNLLGLVTEKLGFRWSGKQKIITHKRKILLDGLPQNQKQIVAHDLDDDMVLLIDQNNNPNIGNSDYDNQIKRSILKHYIRELYENLLNDPEIKNNPLELALVKKDYDLFLHCTEQEPISTFNKSSSNQNLCPTKFFEFEIFTNDIQRKYDLKKNFYLLLKKASEPIIDESIIDSITGQNNEISYDDARNILGMTENEINIAKAGNTNLNKQQVINAIKIINEQSHPYGYIIRNLFVLDEQFNFFNQIDTVLTNNNPELESLTIFELDFLQKFHIKYGNLISSTKSLIIADDFIIGPNIDKSKACPDFNDLSQEIKQENVYIAKLLKEYSKYIKIKNHMVNEQNRKNGSNLSFSKENIIFDLEHCTEENIKDNFKKMGLDLTLPEFDFIKFKTDENIITNLELVNLDGNPNNLSIGDRVNVNNKTGKVIKVTPKKKVTLKYKDPNTNEYVYIYDVDPESFEDVDRLMVQQGGQPGTVIKASNIPPLIKPMSINPEIEQQVYSPNFNENFEFELDEIIDYNVYDVEFDSKIEFKETDELEIKHKGENKLNSFKPTVFAQQIVFRDIDTQLHDLSENNDKMFFVPKYLKYYDSFGHLTTKLIYIPVPKTEIFPDNEQFIRHELTNFNNDLEELIEKISIEISDWTDENKQLMQQHIELLKKILSDTKTTLKKKRQTLQTLNNNILSQEFISPNSPIYTFFSNESPIDINSASTNLNLPEIDILNDPNILKILWEKIYGPYLSPPDVSQLNFFTTASIIFNPKTIKKLCNIDAGSNSSGSLDYFCSQNSISAQQKTQLEAQLQQYIHIISNTNTNTDYCDLSKKSEQINLRDNLVKYMYKNFLNQMILENSTPTRTQPTIEWVEDFDEFLCCSYNSFTDEAKRNTFLKKIDDNVVNIDIQNIGSMCSLGPVKGCQDDKTVSESKTYFYVGNKFKYRNVNYIMIETLDNVNPISNQQKHFLNILEHANYNYDTKFWEQDFYAILLDTFGIKAYTENFNRQNLFECKVVKLLEPTRENLQQFCYPDAALDDIIENKPIFISETGVPGAIREFSSTDEFLIWFKDPAFPQDIPEKKTDWRDNLNILLEEDLKRLDKGNDQEREIRKNYMANIEKIEDLRRKCSDPNRNPDDCKLTEINIAIIALHSIIKLILEKNMPGGDLSDTMQRKFILKQDEFDKDQDKFDLFISLEIIKLKNDFNLLKRLELLIHQINNSNISGQTININPSLGQSQAQGRSSINPPRNPIPAQGEIKRPPEEKQRNEKDIKEKEEEISKEDEEQIIMEKLEEQIINLEKELEELDISLDEQTSLSEDEVNQLKEKLKELFANLADSLAFKQGLGQEQRPEVINTFSIENEDEEEEELSNDEILDKCKKLSEFWNPGPNKATQNLFFFRDIDAELPDVKAKKKFIEKHCNKIGKIDLVRDRMSMGQWTLPIGNMIDLTLKVISGGLGYYTFTVNTLLIPAVRVIQALLYGLKRFLPPICSAVKNIPWGIGLGLGGLCEILHTKVVSDYDWLTDSIDKYIVTENKIAKLSQMGDDGQFHKKWLTQANANNSFIDTELPQAIRTTALTYKLEYLNTLIFGKKTTIQQLGNSKNFIHNNTLFTLDVNVAQNPNSPYKLLEEDPNSGQYFYKYKDENQKIISINLNNKDIYIVNDDNKLQKEYSLENLIGENIDPDFALLEGDNEQTKKEKTEELMKRQLLLIHLYNIIGTKEFSDVAYWPECSEQPDHPNCSKAEVFKSIHSEGNDNRKAITTGPGSIIRKVLTKLWDTNTYKTLNKEKTRPEIDDMKPSESQLDFQAIIKRKNFRGYGDISKIWESMGSNTALMNVQMAELSQSLLSWIIDNSPNIQTISQTVTDTTSTQITVNQEFLDALAETSNKVILDNLPGNRLVVVDVIINGNTIELPDTPTTLGFNTSFSIKPAKTPKFSTISDSKRAEFEALVLKKCFEFENSNLIFGDYSMQAYIINKIKKNSNIIHQNINLDSIFTNIKKEINYSEKTNEFLKLIGTPVIKNITDGIKSIQKKYVNPWISYSAGPIRAIVSSMQWLKQWFTGNTGQLGSIPTSTSSQLEILGPTLDFITLLFEESELKSTNPLEFDILKNYYCKNYLLPSMGIYDPKDFDIWEPQKNFWFSNPDEKEVERKFNNRIISKLCKKISGNKDTITTMDLPANFESLKFNPSDINLNFKTDNIIFQFYHYMKTTQATIMQADTEWFERFLNRAHLEHGSNCSTMPPNPNIPIRDLIENDFKKRNFANSQTEFNSLWDSFDREIKNKLLINYFVLNEHNVECIFRDIHFKTFIESNQSNITLQEFKIEIKKRSREFKDFILRKYPQQGTTPGTTTGTTQIINMNINDFCDKIDVDQDSSICEIFHNELFSDIEEKKYSGVMQKFNIQIINAMINKINTNDPNRILTFPREGVIKLKQVTSDPYIIRVMKLHPDEDKYDDVFLHDQKFNKEFINSLAQRPKINGVYPSDNLDLFKLALPILQSSGDIEKVIIRESSKSSFYSYFDYSNAPPTIQKKRAKLYLIKLLMFSPRGFKYYDKVCPSHPPLPIGKCRPEPYELSKNENFCDKNCARQIKQFIIDENEKFHSDKPYLRTGLPDFTSQIGDYPTKYELQFMFRSLFTQNLYPKVHTNNMGTFNFKTGSLTRYNPTDYINLDNSSNDIQFLEDNGLFINEQLNSIRLDNFFKFQMVQTNSQLYESYNEDLKSLGLKYEEVPQSAPGKSNLLLPPFLSNEFKSDEVTIYERNNNSGTVTKSKVTNYTEKDLPPTIRGRYVKLKICDCQSPRRCFGLNPKIKPNAGHNCKPGRAGIIPDTKYCGDVEGPKYKKRTGYININRRLYGDCAGGPTADRIGNDKGPNVGNALCNFEDVRYNSIDNLAASHSTNFLHQLFIGNRPSNNQVFVHHSVVEKIKNIDDLKDIFEITGDYNLGNLQITVCLDRVTGNIPDIIKDKLEELLGSSRLVQQSNIDITEIKT
uniref:Uncharacterized protein n=1 Tax=viral metagenome TaxID=1070528 RepID=A0A6C0IYK5_9ZZZZ